VKGGEGPGGNGLRRGILRKGGLWIKDNRSGTTTGEKAVSRGRSGFRGQKEKKCRKKGEDSTKWDLGRQRGRGTKQVKGVKK